MAFTVIIPARMHSTRLPNKPLALIGGLPMVIRVALQAQQSNASRVIITSDSQQIATACQQNEIEFIPSLATHQSGTDRIAEVCQKLKLAPDSTVVNVQGDEPLIPPQLINQVATALQQQPECAISTAAHRLNFADFNKANIVKVVTDAKNQALYFSRAPIPCAKDSITLTAWQTGSLVAAFQPLKHIGIYAYRASFLTQFPLLAPAPIEQIESLEQLRAMWHGYKIAVSIFAGELPSGVDTPEDLANVRLLVEGLVNQK